MANIVSQYPVLKYDSSKNFISKIKALENNEIRKLSLGFLDSIKINVLLEDKIDDRDLDRHPNKSFSSKQLYEITKESICEISNSYILIVVEDQFKQLRAVTVTPNGYPIESFLLYDNFLYLSRDFYEKEGRRYSPDKPYYYDINKHEFIFSRIFKIMEPQYKEELIDLDFHDDETNNRYKVFVNESGHFTNLDFQTFESNKIELFNMTIKSSFFQENKGTIIKDQSEKDDNYFKLFLERDQAMRLLSNTKNSKDEILRIIPKIKGDFQIYQQYKTTIGVSGDGDFCDIDSIFFLSKWEKLELKSDLFCIKKYTVQERNAFPELTIKKFKKLVQSVCGNYHYNFVKTIKTKAQLLSYISVSEITLKIELKNKETNALHTQYIVFDIAKGC